VSHWRCHVVRARGRVMNLTHVYRCVVRHAQNSLTNNLQKLDAVQQAHEMALTSELIAVCVLSTTGVTR